MSAPPGSQDLSGTLLADKFKLLSKLGEGGMSTVWKAENTLVHKIVAIKLMHPEYARNPRTLDRFRNEATAAGRIGDAHICDILDFGQSELGPLIVMEMLSGESFAELLERCGRIDPGLAVLIIRQGLRGLSAAHRVGIIHRDLKPENLFLHYPEPGLMVTKLMDFGISKFTEEMGGGKTGANVLMGTPEYMSPEQAEGAANVDVRTDVWAMGVMLYRAISGIDPFRGPTLAATLLAVTTKDPPPLDTVMTGLPPGLGPIVQACLAKSPESRYPTADALTRALAPYEAAPGTLPPPKGEERSAYGGHPTMPSFGQGDPSLPTFSSANQQLEMARASSLAGVPPSGPGPAPAGVMQAASSAAPATWSNELAGPGGPEESWSMGEDVRHRHRPRRSGGGSGGLIALLIVGLIALAGGGYAFFVYGPGAAMIGGSTGTDTGIAVLGTSEGGEPVPADLGATGAEGTGGGETGADATTGTEPGEDSGTTTSGGDSGDEAGASTTSGAADDGGTTSSESSTSSGSGGSGGSGGTSPPKIDKSKLFYAGGLYTPRDLADHMTYAAAMAHCSGLRRKRFAGLRKWRAAKVKEIGRFRSTGVSKTLYWSVEQAGARAKAVSMLGDRPMSLERDSTKARAFCVSSS